MIPKSFGNLICDILLQSDITFSIKNNGGICEAKMQANMEFRIRNQWATIGNENTPWHIHINMNEISHAKFIREFNTAHNRESVSIQIFDSNDNLILRANFSKLYDSDGNLKAEKISNFLYIREKYGKKEVLNFKKCP